MSLNGPTTVRVESWPQECVSSTWKSKPPRWFSIDSRLPRYLCHLQLAYQLDSPRCWQRKGRKPGPWWLVGWDHCMVRLRQLPIVLPQGCHSQSHSWVVWTGHWQGSRCLHGTRWQSHMLTVVLTTCLVLCTALSKSGSIQDAWGGTEWISCNWLPRGSAATVRLLPWWPIAPNHECRKSLWLESTSGSKNGPAWESLEHHTDWECLHLQFHLHTFREWLAGPDQNMAARLPRWRFWLVFENPTQLPMLIPIWLSILISSREMCLISLVFLSEEGSPWHISG